MLCYCVLELLLIISYLYKQMIFGLIIWGIIMLYFRQNGEGFLDWCVKCIIASIPISYLEVTCEPGFHIFKWFNAIILVLTFYLLCKIQKQKMKVNKGILLAFLIVLFSQLIRTFFCEDLPSALIELMQEYIVILPVGLFAIYKNNNGRINTPVYPISNWVDVYYYTVIVSSLCVLFQYFLYFFTGTRIGYTTIWQGRQVFDLLFTGYSVLSIFLGGGILIALYKLLDGENMFFHLITLLIIGFSAAINSSRSGLLSAIVIMILLFINAIFRKKKLRYVFAYSIPVIISMWYIVTFLINHRESLQSGRLFFANNRDFVMRYALQSMSDNVIYFLFGTGINGAKIHGVSQHNMFLEMWYLNGTIFIIPFIILIFAILFITRRKNTWFLLWHIILGHQFISSFFATTFLVPILLIVLCSSESDYYLNSHTYDGSLVNT